MSNIKSSNFDPKYGLKNSSGFWFTKLRPQSRNSCCKYAAYVLVIWILGYFSFVYVFTYKSGLLDEFRKEDMNIKKLQDTLSKLVVKGFARNDNFELERINAKLEKIEDLKATSIELGDGITDEAAKFIRELGLRDPGTNGLAVELSNNISQDIQHKIKAGYDTFGYNGKCFQDFEELF